MDSQLTASEETVAKKWLLPTTWLSLEADSSQSLPRSLPFGPHLYFSLTKPEAKKAAKPNQTSDFKKGEIRNLHCFKLLKKQKTKKQNKTITHVRTLLSVAWCQETYTGTYTVNPLHLKAFVRINSK